MKKNIVITGAGGFIGGFISDSFSGIYNLILVDDFSIDRKKQMANIPDSIKMNREEFLEKLQRNEINPSVVVHLGARTDTAEFSKEVFDKMNVKYTLDLFRECNSQRIKFIYASSAATYGLGEFGFNDSHQLINQLKPLNPYGDSKNSIDIEILKITESGSQTPWFGLKFFNVYGPFEYNKGRMASVVFHFTNQIIRNGKLNLFKSHNEGYLDGEQLRDFIYVKDLKKVILYLIEEGTTENSGIYNLGTGIASSFNQIAKIIFKLLKKEENIQYIDIPIDIRDTYQYYTKAEMGKLRSIGYNFPFYSLEEGISDYISKYKI